MDSSSLWNNEGMVVVGGWLDNEVDGRGWTWGQ
jgi:hypothetical protein